MTPPSSSAVPASPETDRRPEKPSFPRRPEPDKGLEDPNYPDSDGMPMAENTLQFEYLTLLKQGLEEVFEDRDDVFVAGDLFWYAVEGDPKARFAPDVMVAFGRPKGYRGSYKQWEEGGIPPEFVIEILSPGNRAGEMARKSIFYLKHGVKEYVIYDPDRGALEVLIRDEEGDWKDGEVADGWQSELTGVTFSLNGKNLIATRPDGERFESYAELMARAKREAQRAEAEAKRADEEARQKEVAMEKLAALEAKLRSAGIEP